MKFCTWLSLPLAAALAFPAVAQQNNSNSNAAPATATTPNVSSNAAGQNASAQNAGASDASQQNLGAFEPLEAERHEGFWGKLNPFARKQYVQRQMQPIRDRTNELDELTAANAKAIKDVDARSQEGIRLASAKANEADQHAMEAGNRAQQANQLASQASTRLTTVEQVVGDIDQYHPVTQADLHFRPGQTMLSKKAKDTLDQMADTVKSQKGYVVEVQGFSAGKGQVAIENSQRIAQSVVRYLVLDHDIPVYRIYLLGMGNAPLPAKDENAKAKHPTSGGRVEVSLLKNNVEQLGNPGGMSGATAQPESPQ